MLIYWRVILKLDQAIVVTDWSSILTNAEI